MIRPIFLCLLLLLAACSDGHVQNTDFLQQECAIDFPEAMMLLQHAIKKHGYTISRVQHVDKGLNARGYQTQDYKVVFFGKKDEILDIKEHYPELVPYLPLSITIFNSETISTISSLKPGNIAQMYSGKVPAHYFAQWDRDFASIFRAYAECDKY